MAKIIKVGSQNPTFTSQKIKKASPLHTHRNSNEATNPFKFTNFEGNTLQFADVFEGFKPNLKATPANKLRMVATSVTGSMSKIKSVIPESIVNFVRKVRSNLSMAWDYAKNTNVSDAILAIPGARNLNDNIKRNVQITKDILNTPIHLPGIDGLKAHLESTKEILNTPITIPALDGISERLTGMVSRISFHGRQKYANMSVAELETHLAAALAEGGINE